MGWRWRKRVKVAPGVTLNLSDRNVGVTVGGKAGRVSASSSGRVTVGQSVPGTGLYRSEVIASGKRPGSLPGQPVKRAGGCWRWVLYAVIGLVGLMGCGLVGSLVSPARPAPLSDRVVPTWTSTPLPAATATPAATETPLPTETVMPTETPAATETPLPAPTVEERAAPVLVLPTATAESAPVQAVCDVKGNVNSDGEWIYHMPGWRDYSKVIVKPEEGDRWFCSEAEAQAAGFRAPLEH